MPGGGRRVLFPLPRDMFMMIDRAFLLHPISEIQMSSLQSGRAAAGRIAVTAAVVVLMTAGCASGGAGSTGGGDDLGGNADLITLAEIEAAPTGTAFDVVNLLRPRWLRPRTRGTSGFGTTQVDPITGGSADPSGGGTLPVIFMDNTRFGDIGSLRSISSSIIERMEYMDARDATTLYGTGYDGGVIQVFTLR